MNPLKELRQRAGLTLEQVAKQTGVSKQYLIYCEKAVYSNPSGVLIDFYETRVDLDRDEVVRAYYAYQKESRKFNYGRLIEPWVFNTEGHPFKHWRMYSGVGSLSSFCKLFCVHHATMQKFEEKPQSVVKVPEQMEQALLESGYKASTIHSLEKAYYDYRERLNEKVQVMLNDSQ